MIEREREHRWIEIDWNYHKNETTYECAKCKAIYFTGYGKEDPKADKPCEGER